MTELENGIALGIQSVYEAKPLETKANKTNVQEKQVENNNQASGNKTQPKQQKKMNNHNKCVQILQQFTDSFPYLLDYSEVEENLRKLEELCDGRLDWLQNAISGIKSDAYVTTDEDLAQFKAQAKGFVKSVKKTLDVYDSKGIFNEQDESLNNMKAIFFSAEYKKVYEQEGLGKEFNDAKKRLERYLEYKDNAEKAYKIVDKKNSKILDEFSKLEVEVNKQKQRSYEK